MDSNYKNIIVIGASAGGLEALLQLVGGIPADCRAAILVVQHIPAHAESNLARILQSYCPLRAVEAVHEMPLEGGTIYTAAADHHLLIEDDKILVTRGPRENRFRPSVDALFRSAAYNYRDRVIGVVLSGSLNDGTSGMWSINRFGGVTVIQSPEEAIFNSMPLSVKEYTKVDYELPAAEIGPLLGRLAARTKTNKTSVMPDEKQLALTELDIKIARGENALENGVIELGRYSPLACPECHGALTEYAEGKIRRYRCHTGHAHTSESLLASIDENIEKSMWEAMRGMEESKLLLNHTADQMSDRGEKERAQAMRERALQMESRSKLMKEAIVKRAREIPAREWVG